MAIRCGHVSFDSDFYRRSDSAPFKLFASNPVLETRNTCEASVYRSDYAINAASQQKKDIYSTNRRYSPSEHSFRLNHTSREYRPSEDVEVCAEQKTSECGDRAPKSF
jgi:hypothetical protein